MPVGQWGSDATLANNTPNWKMALGAGTQPGANATGNYPFGNTQLMFANSTGNSIIQNQRVGIFGINSNTVNLTGGNTLVYGEHAGWVKITQGSGPILSISIPAGLGGRGYANGQYLTISNTSVIGTVNAVANISTTTLGNLAVLTLLSNGSLIGGKFFTTNTQLLSFVVANGSGLGTPGQTGANLTIEFGGRAGRVHGETLVAMGSMTGNTATPYYTSVI